MDYNKIKQYTDFLTHIDYPAVVFCEDGEVLSVNNSAAKILGNKVSHMTMEPDKFMSSDEFWPTLDSRKSIIWHRILLKVNNRENYVVSGFVNQFQYEDGRKAFLVLFELRADVKIGSMSLERIIDHVGLVAIYLYKPQGVWKTRYVSKNVAKYGYTDGDFYADRVSLGDILVKGDHDILIGNIYKCFSMKTEDFEMKVRIVATDGRIKKTSVKVHLVKTANGDLDGIECLFADSEANEYEADPNSYLMSVMSKIKSFVMVQKITPGKSATLTYITPNVKSMGINADALLKGNKLIADYIHPQDRKMVVDNTTKAIKSGVSDYEEEYRVVDDNGEVRWVKSQNTLSQAEDNTYVIEFFVSDITEKKELQESVLSAKKDYEDKISYILNNNEAEAHDSVSQLIDRDTWSELVKNFATLSGLYNVIIDLDGNQLTEPAGSANHLGYFYDLFERPAYKETYRKLNEIMINNHVPFMMELGDNAGENKICGAPIIIGEKHIATWIVCAYDSAEAEKMKTILESHWNLADMFSNFVYNNKIVAKEATRSKSVEMLLEERINRQKILTEALAALDSDDNKTINNLMKRTGEYLDTDIMVIYSRNMDQFECSYLWTKESAMSADDYLENWKVGNRSIAGGADMLRKGIIWVDKDHPNKNYEKAMEDMGLKSFIALPVELDNNIQGVLVLANTTNAASWRDEEVEFIKDMRNVIQSIISKIEGDGNIRSVNNLLVDTYNHLQVGIFIKDDTTGEVLFANKPLNDMLGYDFVGKDSRIIVREVNSQYSGMVNKPFMSERKEMNWRSYVKPMDKIMDLTQVTMKWLDGRKASLVILRDV